MRDIFIRAEGDAGLSKGRLREALTAAVDAAGDGIRKVLILPPDYTRLHSGAGFITNFLYHELARRGVDSDIMPALGTHVPMTEEQISSMYGDIPKEKFIVHDWRHDVVKIGDVPGDYVASVTGGLWTAGVPVEVNRRLVSGEYGLIVSVGQVVPHEVVGMSNHTKNIFVGAGGSAMINRSHMIGAVCGMESMMGRADTPVRKIFDYASEHFLRDVPLLYALTVTTAPAGKIRIHGLFTGGGRKCFEEAAALSVEKNVDFVPRSLDFCAVMLDPSEFRSTWLGNKAVYRTRMAMADGGTLLILAPGVERFGEDPECDRLIRKYGYSGRDRILEALKSPENSDLRENLSAAAHLIHGSSEGRFRVIYAVERISREEIEAVGYESAEYAAASEMIGLRSLSPGPNRIRGGGEIFYIPNPALGLWIAGDRFRRPTA